jgi:hypothetical protein
MKMAAQTDKKCPTPYGTRRVINAFTRKVCGEIITDAFLDLGKISLIFQAKRRDRIPSV